MTANPQAGVIRALCNALIPALSDDPDAGDLMSATGSSLEAAESVEKALERLSPTRRRRVERLLEAVDHPLVSLIWRGRWTRFSRLPQRDATKVLEAWSTSRLATVRRSFDVLKRIILLEAYGSETAVRTVWSDRGYPIIAGGKRGVILGGSPCPDGCETLVIGSGSGGAVAAAYLAASGQDVVVLEKGPEVPSSSMTGVESVAMRDLFEQGGLLTTDDGGMSLFAGSCLGGGTTVNWSASFRLPDPIRLEWDRIHGIDWMTQPVFNAAYTEIERRTSVGADRADDNGPNAALRSGCESLALAVKKVDRNTKGCGGDQARSCGRCGLGCAHDRKQGATRTFLPDLTGCGGRILTGATVLSILTDRGRVQGVEIQIANPSGPEIRQIKAERVILAGGAIHTPAVLLRSGLNHDQLGRNLFLHPTAGVAGRYGDRMAGWEGAIMSSYTDAFAWMDGPWGVRIETAPIYPGLLASALPWNEPGNHRLDLDLIDRTAAFIVLTRDRSAGRVVLDRAGDPRVHYRVSDADLAMLLTGVVEAAKLHLAAGAESILFPHSERKVLEARHGERMVDLAREIFSWGWGPGFFPLFSAHQMGTCRMGGDGRQYPVDPQGRFRGVDGLYVCDASLFPEAGGVNPALTIQAMAYCVASQVR